MWPSSSHHIPDMVILYLFTEGQLSLIDPHPPARWSQDMVVLGNLQEPKLQSQVWEANTFAVILLMVQKSGDK